jgi:hypothetical protein
VGAAVSAARSVRIYSYASVVVVIFGMGLMSQKAPWDKSQDVAQFGDTWIWLSILLWLAAVALALGVLAPSLTKAGAVSTGAGSAPSQGDRGQIDRGLTGRVAATGGVIALLYAAIVILMVYQPGS